MAYVIKWTTDTNSEVFQDALRIRTDVFIHEQGVDPALEVDGEDPHKAHIVIYDTDRPIAAARVGTYNDPTQLKVQRVAVTKNYRGQGIGHYIMEAIHDYARQEGYHAAVLSAQAHAVPFYESLHYHKLSDESYLDAGIPHYDMVKEIQ